IHPIDALPRQRWLTSLLPKSKPLPIQPISVRIWTPPELHGRRRCSRVRVRPLVGEPGTTQCFVRLRSEGDVPCVEVVVSSPGVALVANERHALGNDHNAAPFLAVFFPPLLLEASGDAD